jgi:4-amino-4-deoxy-L-arabinose transferase-like glycosyltransferase
VRTLDRFGLPTDVVLRWTMLVGVAIRLFIFAPLYPLNNDDHFGVITYFLQQHVLPAADVASQGYHPPLYYLLAAPFVAVAGVRGGELLSLGLSLLNLWLLGRMVATTTLIESLTARRHALALAALLPEFVVFGLFVSNDTLSYLVGTAFLLTAFAYIQESTTRRLVALALALGAGLLTKGTFLAFLPVAVGLVAVVTWRRRAGVVHSIAQAALCVAIALPVGSYKFVENYRRFGRPIVHNLDFPAAAKINQRGTIIGVQSFTDFDLVRLVKNPFERRRTLHSVPLLLYATTWYSFIRSSNFGLLRRTKWRWVARIACLAGIVPTALGLIGLGRMLRSVAEVRRLRALPEPQFVALGQRTTATVLLLATLGIVIWAGVKYDVWTCFQGRLVFPALLSVMLLVATGFDGVVSWRPGAARWLTGALLASYAVWGAYYAFEVAGTVGILSA